MSHHIKIVIDQSLSIDEATLFTQDDSHGAMASFVGYIRNHNEGQAVDGLSYDVHIPLAYKLFENMAKQAQDKWGEDLKIYIAHAHGAQQIGAIAVIVMVSSRHRAESLKACAELIEEIKFKAPVWKKEHYLSGEKKWVAGHSLRPTKS